MYKYLYGFKLYFRNAFEYRFNTFTSLFFSNLRLLIIILFWRLIYGGDTQIVLNGFTLPGVVTYFIVMDIIGSILFSLRNSGFMYSGMIKNGSLGPALLKPHNLNMSIYFRNLSTGIPGIIPQIIFVACILPFIAKFLVWELDAAGAISIFLFILAGTVSAHLICSLLGYMAFWLEEANAVMWSFAVLLNMLTGFFLPLDFFPKWSIQILELLPTSSWGYIQAKIYIGLYPPEKQAILYAAQVIWIGILLLLNAFVWKRGVKKFSSVGG